MWRLIAVWALAWWLVPASAGARPRWEELPLPPPMPKAASQGHVTVPSGAEIFYATYGLNGPPVILLHGGMGNGGHFGFQVPALVERYRVIAIDSRGQGRSTLSKAKLSYRAMADDVVAVMDALEIPRAAMVGWSDGAAIALELGVHHAARVDKLFVFGTNFDASGTKPRKGPSTTFAQYAAKCRSDFQRIARNPKAYDATSTAMLPVWRTASIVTRDQLRSIQAPTLVADGEHDEIIVLDQVKEMARLIPNAKLVVFKDASHFALWQDPAAFNRALLEFLAR